VLIKDYMTHAVFDIIGLVVYCISRRMLEERVSSNRIIVRGECKTGDDVKFSIIKQNLYMFRTSPSECMDETTEQV
jgi:hypothetical protein